MEAELPQASGLRKEALNWVSEIDTTTANQLAVTTSSTGYLCTDVEASDTKSGKRIIANGDFKNVFLQVREASQNAR